MSLPEFLVAWSGRQHPRGVQKGARGAKRDREADADGTSDRTLVHVEADSKLRTYDDVNGGGKRINLDLVQRSVEVLSRPRVEGGPEQEAQGEVEQGEAAASG